VQGENILETLLKRDFLYIQMWEQGVPLMFIHVDVDFLMFKFSSMICSIWYTYRLSWMILKQNLITKFNYTGIAFVKSENFVGVGSIVLILQSSCQLTMWFVVLDSNLVKNGFVCVLSISIFIFPYFIDWIYV